MLCKAFPYNCYQIIYTYITYSVQVLVDFHPLGVGSMMLIMSLQAIKGTLDQTFGAYTSWIWRKSLKQFGVLGGDILKRLLPNSYIQNILPIITRKIVAMPFFHLAPPVFKIDWPVSHPVLLQQRQCHWPLLSLATSLKAHKLTIWTKYDSPTWKSVERDFSFLPT